MPFAFEKLLVYHVYQKAGDFSDRICELRGLKKGVGKAL
jgi:hypothetical protein